MLVLTSQDFDKLASEVVGEYFAGTPLNDSIYKLASSMGMNPDQIKQLVWRSNTAVHLELFEKKAEDKMIEFAVADPNYILGRILTPPDQQPLPEDGSKMASDFFSPVVAETEKVAEAGDVAFEEPVELRAETKAYRHGRQVVAMRKVAHELEQNALMARERYALAVAELGGELRKLGADHAEFEKDAYALGGDNTILLLGDVRRAMNLKEEVTAEKVASSVERLVDTSTWEMKKWAEAQEAFGDAVKFTRSLRWLSEKLGDVL